MAVQGSTVVLKVSAGGELFRLRVAWPLRLLEVRGAVLGVLAQLVADTCKQVPAEAATLRLWCANGRELPLDNADSEVVVDILSQLPGWCNDSAGVPSHPIRLFDEAALHKQRIVESSGGGCSDGSSSISSKGLEALPSLEASKPEAVLPAETGISDAGSAVPATAETQLALDIADNTSTMAAAVAVASVANVSADGTADDAMDVTATGPTLLACAAANTAADTTAACSSDCPADTDQNTANCTSLSWKQKEPVTVAASKPVAPAAAAGFDSQHPAISEVTAIAADSSSQLTVDTLVPPHAMPQAAGDSADTAASSVAEAASSIVAERRAEEEQPVQQVEERNAGQVVAAERQQDASPPSLQTSSVATPLGFSETAKKWVQGLFGPNNDSGRSTSSRDSREIRLAIRESQELDQAKQASTAEARARLQHVLKLYQAQLRPIEADGNCQFRALSLQLYGEQTHHSLLRQRIVQQLRKEQDSYSPYVQGDYDDYCQKMARSGEWGDNVTLQAACDMLGCEVRLLTDMPGSEYVELQPMQPPTAEVAQQRPLCLAFVTEVHYDAIQFDDSV